MKPFFVEGLFIPLKAVRKAGKTGKVNPADVQPFARTLWANSLEEALNLATDALDGGQWVEGPRLGGPSEEERMRSMGAPQFPGFSIPDKKTKASCKK